MSSKNPLLWQRGAGEFVNDTIRCLLEGLPCQPRWGRLEEEVKSVGASRLGSNWGLRRAGCGEEGRLRLGAASPTVNQQYEAQNWMRRVLEREEHSRNKRKSQL